MVLRDHLFKNFLLLSQRLVIYTACRNCQCFGTFRGFAYIASLRLDQVADVQDQLFLLLFRQELYRVTDRFFDLDTAFC